jgi:Ala-tRNA(Pro) deacylase
MAQTGAHFKRSYCAARRGVRAIPGFLRRERAGCAGRRVSLSLPRRFEDTAKRIAALHMAWTKGELLAHLGRLGVKTETVEHPPLHTVEESRALRGEIPGAHTKNLFLKCKKGALWLVTAVEDTPVDLKNLPQKLGSGRLSFGSAELLLDVLCLTPGAVSTFGVINDRENRVSVVLDERLMAYERINLHPLVNTATTGVSRQDLLRFLDECGHPPKIMALS